jgi:hypothetical protein
MTLPLNGNMSTEQTNQNEIMRLIDLLVLRVECLNNEKKTPNELTSLSVTDVDRNLIEYLYYLFTRFIHVERNSCETLTNASLDRNAFVNVCQTLVRNGCFGLTNANVPTTSVSLSSSSSSSISSEETASSNSTLVEQSLTSDCESSNDDKPSECGSSSSTNIDDQETWLAIDVQNSQSDDDATCLNSNVSCLLPVSSKR